MNRSCNSQTAFENLYEACQKHNLLDEKTIDLIVDGGSENKGRLTDFIRSQSTIDLKIAMKDIPFSNTMIEAENGRLKHSFLYRVEIPDYATLEKLLPQIMQENGYERPRHYLGFRTPSEAFDNIDIYKTEIEHNFKKAVHNRTIYNRKFQCVRYCIE